MILINMVENQLISYSNLLLSKNEKKEQTGV